MTINNSPKKIFDIFPPAGSPKKKDEAFFKKREPVFAEKKYPKEKIIHRKSSKRKLKIGGILIVTILIAAEIFNYLLLSQAKIEIWPETQTLSFQEKVEINTKQSQPDFSAKIIPGKIFEIMREASQDFPASGRVLKEEKAKGNIRIYNAYSASSQVLVANTRFISSEGKLFRSIDRAIIPGGTYDKGKLTPGFLDVQIAAAESGESYNIGPSTFSVPGFAGTPKYTAFYGKSLSSMSGGFRGEASQVTEGDLEKAKNNLSAELSEEGMNILRNEIPSDFILLDGAKTQEAGDVSSSPQEGGEAKSFNLRLKIISKVLTFKKSDLENFVREFILSHIQNENSQPEREIFWLDKKIHDASLNINYNVESMDWKENKLVLNLSFSAKVYPGLDEKSLKEALAGKNLKEAKILLDRSPYVSDSRIKFWPLGAQKIPQNIEKIKIKLNIDPAPNLP